MSTAWQIVVWVILGGVLGPFFLFFAAKMVTLGYLRAKAFFESEKEADDGADER